MLKNPLSDKLHIWNFYTSNYTSFTPHFWNFYTSKIFWDDLRGVLHLNWGVKKRTDWWHIYENFVQYCTKNHLDGVLYWTFFLYNINCTTCFVQNVQYKHWWRYKQNEVGFCWDYIEMISIFHISVSSTLLMTHIWEFCTILYKKPSILYKKWPILYKKKNQNYLLFSTI